MTTAISDRLEFAAVLGAEGVPSDVILDVLRDARTIHRLAEIACERELTSTEEKRDEIATARIGGRLAAYGIESHFQGDPRGAVVKLRLPSGRANDFGGEGLFCVPTR
jgi:hypothetical protein